MFADIFSSSLSDVPPEATVNRSIGDISKHPDADYENPSPLPHHFHLITPDNGVCGCHALSKRSIQPPFYKRKYAVHLLDS